jgi:hypothetical protein
MKKLVLAVLLCVCASASAELVLDQEQAVIGTPPPAVAGTARGDEVAQVFTAGLTGDLDQVDLAIGCDGGTVTIEIVNTDRWGYQPTHTVRARTVVDGATLPAPIAWHSFTFEHPVTVSSGAHLAILVRVEGGKCSLARSNYGDPYHPGSAWWRPGDLPEWNWLSVCELPGTGCDLAFRTYVDRRRPPPSHPCIVTGFGALPFPDFVPVCRCVQDEGIREQRCTLLHPAFAAVRRIPLDVAPGDPFTIKWTVWPITTLKELSVLDEFSGGPKSPLTFVSPNGPVTLEYNATAPLKGDAFKVETSLNLPDEEGVMTTVIDVKP